MPTEKIIEFHNTIWGYMTALFVSIFFHISVGGGWEWLIFREKFGSLKVNDYICRRIAMIKQKHGK